MLRLMLAAAAASALMAAAPAGATAFNTLSGAAPQVIGHRGAPAYLPEHTLGGYELAIAMGADIVEPDVQLTSDGFLVAMHDTTLTRTTNVEALFAPRNGTYNVSDFTLAEIKTLTVEPTGPASTTYPGFTPSSPEPFMVPTLGEVLDFVNAHNAATGDKIGVYPESKVPNRSELSVKIVEELQAKGFVNRDQNSYIQTFSHDGAREIYALQNLLGMDNAVAALGAAVFDGSVYGVFDFTNNTVTPLEEVATFAHGVGVTLGSPNLDAGFFAAAHALGLEVHGWTFRPTSIEAAETLFGQYIALGMDAMFTDYPDLGRQVVDGYVAPIPVPAALPMLVAALGGLALIRRRAA
ncbi:glycerophosphodiester phosphodiesterase family protein [Rubrimonas cliftonensis]|uniref:Glycerophosphoryl diester phosphodiesterase n=1 Tax=Rubrimonas cliftonensis TaxID=89524 RepID=A0A1H4BUT3_9RHOB|nr:glycerophosphodiester phosphodiesterase family protein [Rubrimonas cliftonensis]SEA51901.1 glycerophosphoryl diester phosphodiesterase [Rubrimonas cliftonensis]